MTDTERREAARQFINKWNGKGKEDEDARSYWIDILVNVLGMDHVTDRVQFEKKVAGDKSKKRIDVYIPETNVLIEQKSLGIDLDKPQAGHDGKTPYEQAKEYDNLLPYDERARWIITSNFAEIWIYDMSVMKPEPLKLQLADLQNKYTLLDFLIKPEVKEISDEIELSIKAGELVGKIHDRFLTQYNDPLAKRTQRSLNILCVRLVFCLYAEDARLFGAPDAFKKYIEQYDPKDIRNALIELFRVLDTPIDERADLYLSDELAAFPYVNGGLFQDENIVIPRITEDIKEVLMQSAEFDWSEISPTIFGAVFESTLNPETRRKGGMHYTSIENIHKVIDPLFLDDIWAEFHEIEKIAVPATQKKKLNALQDKIARLRIMDPSCGSGNFLTESYLSLRRIENEILKLKVALDKKTMTGQISFGLTEDTRIKVSINQFYGIEINDFACKVAQSALWIAESQMLKETEGIVRRQMEFFPLKTYNNIHEANALQTDWNNILSSSEASYVCGNPPFLGYSNQTPSQKEQIKSLYVDEKGKPYRTAGKIDYVSGWYWKAAEYIKGTNARAAFVSTNSICQGEQVAGIWKPLYNRFNIHIDFAYRSFVWDSEASDKAHVHCVIVGFSSSVNKKERRIYDAGTSIIADNINPYLVDSNDVFIESRKKPLCNVSEMVYGNKPTDGGFLFLTPDDRKNLITKEPASEQFIRKVLGSVEYINNKDRYCLWLINSNPTEIKKCPTILKRIEEVKAFRENSTKEATRRDAATPSLFQEIRQPSTEYLIIPRVSSERRRYVPIGYISPEVIASDSVQIIPNATRYEYGILTSNVHMAWMRSVAGRLKSDYRYSKDIVYNNFPWPDPTPEQKAKIEATAQGILDARDLYPDSSLADLYDPLTMPPELRKAHTANDKAVMAAYGFSTKMTESECVAELMKMYQKLVEEQ